MTVYFRWLAVFSCLAWGQAVSAVELLVQVGSPVTVGDSVDVQVSVDDVADLAGFEFSLAYDVSLLAGVTATSGDLFGADGFTLASGFSVGMADFSEVSLATFGVDVTVPALLATFHFTALASGISQLTLGQVLLSDSRGNPIGAVNLSNAQVEIIDSTLALPGSLSLLGLGWWLCGRRRRGCFPA